MVSAPWTFLAAVDPSIAGLVLGETMFDGGEVGSCLELRKLPGRHRLNVPRVLELGVPVAALGEDSKTVRENRRGCVQRLIPGEDRRQCA